MKSLKVNHTVDLDGTVFDLLQLIGIIPEDYPHDEWKDYVYSRDPMTSLASDIIAALRKRGVFDEDADGNDIFADIDNKYVVCYPDDETEKDDALSRFIYEIRDRRLYREDELMRDEQGKLCLVVEYWDTDKGQARRLHLPCMTYKQYIHGPWGVYAK